MQRMNTVNAVPTVQVQMEANNSNRTSNNSGGDKEVTLP